MHRDARHLHVAELGEHGAQALAGCAADGPCDHHDLTAVDVAFDGGTQFLRVCIDDADPGDLGPRVPCRGRQCVRVDVVDLPVARCAGDVDQFPADGHHRHPRSWVHQHPLAPDRSQQSDLSRSDDRPGPHRDVAGLDVVADPADVRARTDPAQHPHPRLPAVGPPQRQYRIGQSRHRRPGLDASGLPGLQTGRGA